jgi:flagellar protein FlaJ
VTDEEIIKRPHAVRLARGVVPYQEALNPYSRVARKVMGPIAKKYVKQRGETPLEITLLKAHMKVNVEDYYAFAWFNTLVAAIVCGLVVGFLTPLMVYLAASIGAAFATLSVLAGIPIAYVASMYYPQSVANGRQKDIDLRISYAMSFVSTMASADVNIDVIFKELAKQTIYGEIQKEAQWITRDVELLGKDILNAIRDASARTPSIKWQNFLQGVVTTTLSGGQLKPYFVLKTEQFSKEAKMDERRKMETLGMLAESFVTVVVAMPLFLIVMMSLMGTVGGGANSIDFLYIIVYAMIPMSQIGFIVAIKSMAEEV